MAAQLLGGMGKDLMQLTGMAACRTAGPNVHWHMQWTATQCNAVSL